MVIFVISVPKLGKKSYFEEKKQFKNFPGSQNAQKSYLGRKTILTTISFQILQFTGTLINGLH